MKRAKGAVTVALLLFVGATVGLLVAQEVARTPAEGELSATSFDRTVESGGASSTSPMESRAIPAEANDEEPNRSAVDSAADVPPVGNVEARCVVDAIYFHNTHRCWTCKKIEQDARAIVEAVYADLLAAGTLRWSAINMEEDRRYVERYDLTKPTLILVRRVADATGEWQVLEETWSLVRNETKFALYIEDAVGAFLEGCR